MIKNNLKNTLAAAWCSFKDSGTKDISMQLSDADIMHLYEELFKDTKSSENLKELEQKVLDMEREDRMAYCMLTGAVPFGRLTQGSLIKNNLINPLVPPILTAHYIKTGKAISSWDLENYKDINPTVLTLILGSQIAGTKFVNGKFMFAEKSILQLYIEQEPTFTEEVINALTDSFLLAKANKASSKRHHNWYLNMRENAKNGLLRECETSESLEGKLEELDNFFELHTAAKHCVVGTWVCSTMACPFTIVDPYKFATAKEMNFQNTKEAIREELV